MKVLQRLLKHKTNDNQKMYRLNSKTIRAMVLGGAIGDAIGVPYEFMQRDKFKVVDLDGYKKHYQPPGTWSDDTAFTLCQIDNIVDGGSSSDLMEKFLRCKELGYNAPNGKLFDIGSSCLNALDTYHKTLDIRNCGQNKEYDNGNGALMRIHPLAVILLNDPNLANRFSAIKNITKITHSHSRAIIGSYIYIETLIALLKGKDINHAIEEVNLNIKELTHFNILSEEELKELNNYKNILTLSILGKEREEIKSTGYVVDTLEAVIWVVGKSDNFKDAVLTAVNLGGDTDTIASITGVVSGIVFGYRNIPQNWINKILDINIIIKKANELYETSVK